MTYAKLMLVSTVVGLTFIAGESSAMAAVTTTTPGQTKIGTDYFLVPKGTFAVGAGQAAVSIEYTYGLVVGGVDQPGGLPATIINLTAPNWQGANVAANVGQKYWVKSRLNYTENGMNKQTKWVRGEHTIVTE